MAEIAQLPALVAANWDWQVRAACRGLDDSTFFHPDNERGPSKRRREQRAKSICAGCPVVQQCLSWALQVREPYGVWGGLSVTERAELLDTGAAWLDTGAAWLDTGSDGPNQTRPNCASLAHAV